MLSNTLFTAELSRPSVNNKRSCSSAAVLAHSLSTEISYTPKEMDVQMTLASPRHFLRRGGMAQAQIQDHFGSSKLAKQVRLTLWYYYSYCTFVACLNPFGVTDFIFISILLGSWGGGGQWHIQHGTQGARALPSVPLHYLK